MGTLLAIFRQACRLIPEDELQPEFYAPYLVGEAATVLSGTWAIDVRGMRVR